MAYFTAVRKLATKETISVWNVHRYWFSLAGVFATVFFGAARGSLTMTSFQDIALNGAGGFGLTFLVSYAVNFLHAPALIDTEKRKRIEELEKERPYVVSKPYPKNLGNLALKKETIVLVADLKDLFIRQEEHKSEWLHGGRANPSASEEQRSKDWQDSHLRMEKARQDILAVYWKQYQTKAILLRDELRSRLGGVPPLKKHGAFDIQYEVGQAGPTVNVQDVANELEFLAMQITD